jgi:colicin import membrane protein
MMSIRPAALVLRMLFAIFLVAFCAALIQAKAQITSKKVEEATEQREERARIAREREALTQALEIARQTCYQNLAVTPCLNEARDTHNEKMRDLKRQEVALNDARRKRAAAERLQAIDERNSPQVQQKIAERRGQSMEAAKQREASLLQSESSRAAKQGLLSGSATASAPAAPAGEDKTSARVRAPQGKPRSQPAAKPANRLDVAKIEQSRQQAAQREQDLAKRRAEAQEREAKRKKPAAKPLPLPDSAK